MLLGFSPSSQRWWEPLGLLLPPLNFALTEPRRGEAQEGEQPAGPCPSRPASIVRSIKEFDPLWEFLLVFHIPFVLSDERFALVCHGAGSAPCGGCSDGRKEIQLLYPAVLRAFTRRVDPRCCPHWVLRRPLHVPALPSILPPRPASFLWLDILIWIQTLHACSHQHQKHELC